MASRVFTDIGDLFTLAPAFLKGGRRVQEADLGRIPKAALVVENGLVRWAGASRDLNKTIKRLGLRSPSETSLKGATVLPAFVESHTHLVHAGSRASEFELRQSGVSYQEIASRGGGILSTVKSVRELNASALAKKAQTYAEHFISQGVTTIEIKSGYGLTVKDEIKMLEAAGKLEHARIVRTFLGAHAIPAEFNSASAYLAELEDHAHPILTKKKLACRIDAFVDKGYFPPEIIEGYFARAKTAGFDIVVHADQLHRVGAAQMAVRLGARSAEHLIQINADDVRALAGSEVTSVLLPTADLYMKCAYPPARALIDAGARVALATDFNPGTSPTMDLALVGLLARLEMKMTLPEVIAAYTVGGAFALGLEKQLGSLSVGHCADFVVLSGDLSDLFYGVGSMPVVEVFREGRRLFNGLRR